MHAANEAEIRVLHVDDSLDLAKLTAEFLERGHDGMTVATAMGAERGLAHLKEDDARVDCIVSDYDMPGTDGLEFLAAVREIDPDLPFILFTGKGSEEIASEAISAGVTDYLQKRPGTEQYTILGNRIENAVSQYRAQRTLRAEREFTERALDVLADLFFLIDTSARFVRWNSRVTEVTGYTDVEMDGKRVADFLRDEEVPAAFEAIEEAIETGESTLVADLVTKEGGAIPYEFRGASITDGDGTVTGICGIAREVSTIDRSVTLDGDPDECPG